MKTLIVYDLKTGDINSIQENVSRDYGCMVKDIENSKEIIGVNVNTKEVITVDRLATNTEKEILKRELEAKDKELELQQNKNEQLTDKIIELTAQNLIKSEEE